MNQAVCGDRGEQGGQDPPQNPLSGHEETQQTNHSLEKGWFLLLGWVTCNGFLNRLEMIIEEQFLYGST